VNRCIPGCNNFHGIELWIANSKSLKTCYCDWVLTI
jgi:hypothetical protein